MNRLNRYGMLAVAALAFIGCSKEVDLQEPKTEVSGTHTLTFVVQKQADTRTAVVEGETTASYVWTAGDDQYFNVFENGVAAQSVSVDFSNNYKTATVKATFQNTSAETFAYSAVFAKSISKDNNNPLIPAEQTPALTSFDPSADVLVSAEDLTLEGGIASDENTEFLFIMERVVSVNKMTLKGLKPGEKISSVELASDKYFSSRYKLSDGSYIGDAMKLTLKYDALEDAVVAEDGSFPVYFVSAPVEGATLNVRVVTDEMVYTRDDFTSKLTLETGKFRRFGINLSGYGEVIQDAVEYTLVESADQIAAGGEYLLVSTKTNNEGFVAAGTFNSNNYYGVADVEVTNDDVIIITSEQVTVFTLEESAKANQFFIMDSDGNYLYAQDKNNVYRSSDKGDNSYLWTVTVSGITNVGFSDRLIQYNRGNPRFACYKNSSAAISLYVNKSTLVELADPELSFDPTDVNVTWTEQGSFVAPVLSNPHNVAVNYSSSDAEVATVDADGTVTFVGNGTTVITATSEKTETYSAGSAQYTLTVSGAPVELAFETIAELNDLAETTAAEYSGKLTNAVVSFVASNSAAIIKDATGSITYYKSSHGLKQGQTFSGELDVTLVNYNGLYSEITACSATFTGEGGEVAPDVVTLSDLIGNYATYQNAYVKVDDLTVTSVSGQNINVENGDDTYVVYDNTKKATCVAGDVISVVGTVTKYGSTEEIKVWNIEDLTITQEHAQAEHTVTFTQPAEGGTITVSVDGAPIESGAKVMEGTEVTLTATVSDGYSFDGWSVSGATVSGSTTTETITVGASDVVIAANISKIVAGTTVEFTASDSGGMSGSSVALSGQKEDVSINITSGTIANEIRIFKNQSITISVPSGKTISKIVFTCTASGTAQYGPGCFEETTGYSYSGNTGTWVGSSSSVTLKASSNQVRATSIKVTYN